MKKKALIVLTDLSGGGVERVILDILPHINKYTDWEIDLFLIKKYSDYIDLNSKFLNFKIYYSIEDKEKIKLNFHKILMDLYRVAKNYTIIIGGMELIPTYFSFLISAIQGKPKIGWIHSPLSHALPKISKIDNIFFKNIYPNLDYLIFPSKYTLSDYKSLINAKNQKLEIIYNPISLKEIEKKANIPVNDNLPKKYILAIGRIVDHKGFDFLIKSFSKLIEKNPNITHKLIILGKGKEEQNLKKLIKLLNLENRIEILGFKKNPYPYIKNADFFVLSSRFEGFGMVLLESLALKKAVISTSCPGGPIEILNYGEFGVLVQPDNVFELANAMEKLIYDKDFKNSFENKAILRAKDFDIKKIINQWEIFLDKILKKS